MTNLLFLRAVANTLRIFRILRSQVRKGTLTPRVIIWRISLRKKSR
jgi:hypothetical protein